MMPRYHGRVIMVVCWLAIFSSSPERISVAKERFPFLDSSTGRGAYLNDLRKEWQIGADRQFSDSRIGSVRDYVDAIERGDFENKRVFLIGNAHLRHIFMIVTCASRKFIDNYRLRWCDTWDGRDRSSCVTCAQHSDFHRASIRWRTGGELHFIDDDAVKHLENVEAVTSPSSGTDPYLYLNIQLNHTVHTIVNVTNSVVGLLAAELASSSRMKIATFTSMRPSKSPFVTTNDVIVLSIDPLTDDFRSHAPLYAAFGRAVLRLGAQNSRPSVITLGIPTHHSPCFEMARVNTRGDKRGNDEAERSSKMPKKMWALALRKMFQIGVHMDDIIAYDAGSLAHSCTPGLSNVVASRMMESARKIDGFRSRSAETPLRMTSHELRSIDDLLDIRDESETLRIDDGRWEYRRALYPYFVFVNPEKTATEAITLALRRTFSFKHNSMSNIPYLEHIDGHNTLCTLQRFVAGVDYVVLQQDGEVLSRELPTRFIDMSSVVSFVVARNPWDRLVSWYLHNLLYAANTSEIQGNCRYTSSVTNWASPLPHAGFDAIDFEYFRSQLTKEEWRNFLNACELKSVTKFSTLCDGTLSRHTKTIRFENLTSGFGDVLNSMGVLDAHNVAKHTLLSGLSNAMKSQPTKYGRRRSQNKRHYSCYFTKKTAAFVRSLYFDDVKNYGYVFEDKCDENFL